MLLLNRIILLYKGWNSNVSNAVPVKQSGTDYIGVCGTYDLKATGDVPICINCGQCANVCPPDSITEKVEAYEVAAAMRDPEKIVIFSTSPSVRIALGEEFAMATVALLKEKW